MCLIPLMATRGRQNTIRVTNADSAVFSPRKRWLGSFRMSLWTGIPSWGKCWCFWPTSWDLNCVVVSWACWNGSLAGSVPAALAAIVLHQLSFGPGHMYEIHPAFSSPTTGNPSDLTCLKSLRVYFVAMLIMPMLSFLAHLYICLKNSHMKSWCKEV